MDIKKAFAEVLKQKRKQIKISQEELALNSNMDRTFLSEIERGLKQPTITTLQKIAIALNMKPSELLKEVEDFIENNK